MVSHIKSLLPFSRFYVYMFISVHACGDQKSVLGVFLSQSPHHLLRQSPAEPGTLILVDWLPRNPPASASSALAVQSPASMSGFFPTGVANPT